MDFHISLKIFRFDTGLPGPQLLVTAGIHGDETAGVLAADRVVGELEAGKITLTRGSLTIVPRTNPEACTRNTMMVNRNMNRGVRPYETISCYEDALTNDLTKLIAASDYYIDLHAYRTVVDEAAAKVCFAFTEPEPAENFVFSAALNGDFIIHGWEETYKKLYKGSAYEDVLTTDDYARRCNVIASTFECGLIGDPAAEQNGYDAILSALAYCNMARFHFAFAPAKKKARQIKYAYLFTKQKPGKFARGLKNFTEVRQGEVLALYDDGETIKAPKDGFMLFVKPEDQKIGGEWFSLAYETP